MERYNDRMGLIYALSKRNFRAAEVKKETYEALSFAIASANTPADIWAYIDVEKKKANLLKEDCLDGYIDLENDEDNGYDEWLDARDRIAALEEAEAFLRKLERHGE